jgi:hypothetical protein
MKIRIEVEVGPTELREFLGLPDVAHVQQEALELLLKKLRSGAASGGDALALLRGMVPESLLSLSEWQRLIGRALQTGKPVTVETTVTPAKSRAAGGARKRAGTRKRGGRTRSE